MKPRARIDHLDRLASSPPCRKLLHRDAIWRGLVRTESDQAVSGLLQPIGDHAPVDIAQKRVDVRSGLGTELRLVGVLVHVKHQQRNSVQSRLRVVVQKLVVEPTIGATVAEDHPAGSSNQRLCERDELSLPCKHSSELLLDRCTDRLRQTCAVT